MAIRIGYNRLLRLTDVCMCLLLCVWECFALFLCVCLIRKGNANAFIHVFEHFHRFPLRVYVCMCVFVWICVN